MNVAQESDTRLSAAATDAIDRFVAALPEENRERTWHVSPYAPFVVADYGETLTLGHMIRFGDDLVWESVNVERVVPRVGACFYRLRFVMMTHGVDWGAVHGNMEFANAFLPEMAARYLGAMS